LFILANINICIIVYVFAYVYLHKYIGGEIYPFTTIGNNIGVVIL
jgi:hypothetical protein